jgi:hypothetical protein
MKNDITKQIEFFVNKKIYYSDEYADEIVKVK